MTPVADRLSPIDSSFLSLEEGNTPMHVGNVLVFDAPDSGFDHDALVGHIEQRLAYVPRFRQKVRHVPGNLAAPVWVDDPAFDITYHVRRSALPKPGTDEQLEEFVARIAPRPLDRSRPLWEVYLVEGLAQGRFAIITKTHNALVDGLTALDLGQVILDGQPTPADDHVIPDGWVADREPSDGDLVTDALLEIVKSPTRIVDTVGSGIADVRATTRRVAAGAMEVLGTLARVSTRPAPVSPLNAEVGAARRFVMVGTDLEDYRTVRGRLMKGRAAEDVTINDVVLATLAGAFRSWLLTRGESVKGETTVRAMVPISVVDQSDREGQVGGVRAAFVNLPVGEPGPSMRLHQISFAMRQEMENGQALGAEAIRSLGGFAPPTLHTVGARLGQVVSRRLYNLVITNVPGPQYPLYALDARLLATYPVMPLGAGQALAIGLTSYDGGVYYGLNCDRDSMPDADVLGQSIVDSLAELLAAKRPGRR